MILDLDQKCMSFLVLGACLAGSAHAASAPVASVHVVNPSVVLKDGKSVQVEVANDTADVVSCQLEVVATAQAGSDKNTFSLTATVHDRVVRSYRSTSLVLDFASQLEKMRKDHSDDAAYENLRLVDADLAKSKLSCTTIDESKQNLWVDDNKDKRLAKDLDTVTSNLQELGGGDVAVLFKVESAADYVRLCDGATSLKFEARDHSSSETEHANFSRKLLMPGQALEQTSKFSSSDLGNNGFYHPVAGSELITISCLRWTGYTLPDPMKNPAQRPTKLPHEVCDPAVDSCGNISGTK